MVPLMGDVDQEPYEVPWKDKMVSRHFKCERAPLRSPHAPDSTNVA